MGKGIRGNSHAVWFHTALPTRHGQNHHQSAIMSCYILRRRQNVLEENTCCWQRFSHDTHLSGTFDSTNYFPGGFYCTMDAKIATCYLYSYSPSAHVVRTIRVSQNNSCHHQPFPLLLDGAKPLSEPMLEYC